MDIAHEDPSAGDESLVPKEHRKELSHNLSVAGGR
jgi:hypothetical protein